VSGAAAPGAAGLSRAGAWALARTATLTMAVSYADRQTLAELLLERAEEDGLGDVLRLGRAAEQAHRGGEHHVLVFANERLKPLGVGHCRFGHLRSLVD